LKSVYFANDIADTFRACRYTDVKVSVLPIVVSYY